MSNKERYKQAMDAISRLFSDTSIGHDKTLENLQGLRDEIDMMIDSTKTAIRIAEKQPCIQYLSLTPHLTRCPSAWKGGAPRQTNRHSPRSRRGYGMKADDLSA